MEFRKSFFVRSFITGIGLCGLCCALPFIGAAFGIGTLTIVSHYLDEIGWGLMIIAAGFFIYRHYKKCKAKCCSVDCNCNPANQE
jgi:hypothetical protein